MSVQRQYYDETFSSGTTEGTVDFQSVVYASDRGVALASANKADNDPVGGLTANGTYFVDYFFSGGTIDSQNAGYLREFRLTVSGSGSSISVESKGPYDVTWQFVENNNSAGGAVALAPNMDVARYCVEISALPGGVEGMESKVPGSWSVQRAISGPGGSSGPTLVRTFDMRLLALRNIRTEKPKFDPNSEENFSFLRGDVVALPVGWQPTGDLAARIDIFANGPIYTTNVEGSLSLLPSIGPLGEVAEFAVAWDGTIPGQDEPAEGVFQVQGRAIADTPGVGTTKTASKDDFVNVVSCACKCEKSTSGGSKMTMPLSGMPQSPVGPSMDMNLAYCTASSNREPGSMGYGWHGKSSCRVFEPAGQNGALVYKSESGSYLRWNLVGSDYVPAFANNYVEIVKNGSEPVYVVTFENQSVREFNSDGRLIRELDRNGQALEYDVDGNGNLLSMTDAANQSIYFNYNGRMDGQPCFIRALDPTTGRETELVYDANDRLEYLVQPGDGASETTQFVYDPEGRLAAMILPSGQVPVVYEYDFADRVVEESYNFDGSAFESVRETYYDGDALFLAGEFGLNLSGLAASGLVPVCTLLTDLTAANSPGRVTFLIYDLIGNLVRREELVYPGDPGAVPPLPPRFNTTLMEYNDPLNPRLLTRQIAPNGFTLTMTYNAQGDLASVNESYSNTTIEYKYTEDLDTPPVNPKWRHLLREIHRPTVTVNGTPVTYKPTIFSYDPTYGNLVEVEDAAENSIAMQVSADGLVEQITDRRGFTTIFTYNNTTRRLESIETPGGPSPATSRTTEFTYDDYLNLETVTAPTLPAAWFTYDGQNRPKRSTSPLGFYSESTYVDGLLTSMTMPSNQGSSSSRRETRFFYDQADRLEQVQAQWSSMPDFELRVGYLYDGLSQLKNLVRLKDATLKATVYDYDFLGRMVRSEDFLVPGRKTFIAYADYCTGNLTTTPRGVQREATYDERCRLRQLQTQDETHEFEYDELNRLVSVRMGSRYAHGSPAEGGEYSTGFYTHETRYTYDELDRVVEILHPNGETVSYEYNENGDVTRMVDVHNKETLYEYYNDGRLLSVTYEGQLFSYTYDAVGRLESLTYPTTPDTLVLNFSWDDDGRLLSMEYLKNNAAFQSFTYGYDDSGNRVTMDEVDPSSVSTNWEYGYDWFNRLTSVTKNTVLQESYTYDESDNRYTVTRGNQVWRYSCDLADQINSIALSTNGGPEVVVESFTPDEDGNVRVRVKDGVTTEYEWDTMNRLRQVKVDGDVVVRSLYDAEGIRRLSKDDSGDQSKFFSSGGMSLADQRASGPVSFIQGHQLLGAEQGGDLHIYLCDGLGSVRLVVDATGAIEGAFDHDVWGNPDVGVTPPGAELRAHSFVGGLGQRNEGNGIYYARQRWFDANLGRWLSQDPIGFAGDLNLYAGMGNNPINRVDPSGLDWSFTSTQMTRPEYFTNVWDFYVTLKARIDQGAKISKIDLDKGHGNCGMQGITDGLTQRSRSSPPGGIYADYSRVDPTVVIRVRDMPGHEGQEFDYDMIELLRGHLTSDAAINFHGCATADSDTSLVALTSRLLPNIPVSGPPGSYHPFRPAWKGKVDTYIGGKIQPNGHFR